ncbi:MAG: hypothetical protein JWN32_2105 [Solirubrobacterales bacterium]|nr:hypothetical protein [Solirubrobacterales bacterium]
MHKTKRLISVLGVAALAVPGAALADPGHGSGHGPATTPSPVEKQTATKGSHHSPPAKGRGRNLVFKGILKAVDTTASTVTLTVSGGNRAAKAFKGQDVTFDVSKARIRAADSNANGTPNELADGKVGDRAVVHVHLAKGTTVTQPLAARSLVDQTQAR